MDFKTKVHAEKGKQELVITRKFDLPVELLFQAFVEPKILEQWMGTKVIKLKCEKHGCFRFETIDPKGNKYDFNGVIHDFVSNQAITRTFEMENSGFGVQLEILQFKELNATRSKLIKQVIYQSTEHRDKNLKLPFVQGINIAHNRLQEIAIKLK